MKVMAIETSTEYLSIACLEDENLRHAVHDDVGVRHSEILVPSIDDILRKSGWTIRDVDLICIGLGPGSFTGLRIGMATVKGFVVSTGCKVIGVPSMDAIVMTFPENTGKVAPMLDARKGKIYTALYEWTDNCYERRSEFLLVRAGEFLGGLKEKVYLAGDAVRKYNDELARCSFASYDAELDWHPNARDIGLLGYKRYSNGTDNPETLEPLYLHPKECNITRP